MDDITNQRFRGIEDRLTALENKVEGIEARLGKRIDDFAADLRSHMTGMEIRLATAITGLAGSIADVKAFMVERDQTQARLAKLEEKYEALERRTGAKQ